MKSNTSLDHLPMRVDYYAQAASGWASLIKPYLKGTTEFSEWFSGWSPKILLALMLSKFDHNYYAIDATPQSLSHLKYFYDLCDKSFNYQAQTADVLTQSVPRSQVLILNHALDDLFLFAHAKSQKTFPYSDIQHLSQSWAELSLKPHAYFDGLIEQLAQKISENLSLGGIVIVHQYPGYQEVLYQMQTPIDISMAAQSNLEHLLIRNYHFEKLKPTKKQLGTFFHPRHLVVLRKA